MGLKSWIESYNIGKEEVTLVSGNKRRKDFFLRPFLVTAFNPKDIIFFVAFFPQFINQEASIFFQSIVLMVTFLFLVTINISAYGYFSASLGKFVRSAKSKAIISKISGTVLIIAGLITFTLNTN